MSNKIYWVLDELKRRTWEEYTVQIRGMLKLIFHLRHFYLSFLNQIYWLFDHVTNTSHLYFLLSLSLPLFTSFFVAFLLPAKLKLKMKVRIVKTVDGLRLIFRVRFPPFHQTWNVSCLLINWNWAREKERTERTRNDIEINFLHLLCVSNYVALGCIEFVYFSNQDTKRSLFLGNIKAVFRRSIILSTIVPFTSELAHWCTQRFLSRWIFMNFCISFMSTVGLFSVIKDIKLAKGSISEQTRCKQ